jgi:Zn-dependent protease with chaperone function
MEIRSVVALVMALLSGPLTWLFDRRMANIVDTPDFTERFFKHRMFMMRFDVALIVAIVALQPSLALISVSLSLLAIWAGSFPLRRKLFAEQWNVFEFLWWRVRLIIGTAGYWLALMVTPYVVRVAGTEQWPYVLFALLLLSFFQHELMTTAFGSTPLSDATLVESFREVAGRATVPLPAIHEGGPTRGRWANAVALPKGKRSRILFTRTLLKELDSDELTAVFGHELAHVEQWAKPEVERARWLGIMLIPAVAIIFSVVIAGAIGPSFAWELAWPAVVAFALANALIRRQQKETDADVRAVALGVNPNALITGLEKIHDLNKMPHRFDARLEKRMTHPSLAKRALAIRRAAGLLSEEETAALAQPKIVQGKSVGTIVRFASDAVELFEGANGTEDLDAQVARGAAPSRRLAYAEMTQLSVRASLGRYEIVAAGPGQHIRVPIDRRSFGAATEITNEVRGNFAQLKASAESGGTSRVRVLALVTLLFAFFPGIPFPTVCAAFFTLVAPSVASAAAMTGAVMASLAWIITHRESLPGGFDGAVLAIAAAISLMSFLALFQMLRQSQRDERRKGLLIFLAIGALLSALPLLVSPFLDHKLMRFHLAAQRPSLVIFLLAIAAALAAPPRRKRGVAVVGGAAVLLLLAASPRFITAANVDPFVSDAGPREIAGSLPLERSTTLTAYATTLRLSGAGDMMAVGTPSESMADEEEVSQTFLVGSFGRALGPLQAEDVAFARRGELLALRSADGYSFLDLIKIADDRAPAAVRTWKLPPLYAAHVVASSGSRWQVVGVDAQAGRSRVHGELDSDAFDMESFGRSSLTGIHSMELGEGRAVVLASMQHDLSAPDFVLSPATVTRWLVARFSETSLLRAENAGRKTIASTILPIVHLQSVPGTDQYVALASDHRRTYVAMVDPTSLRIRRVGSFLGRPQRAIVGSDQRLAAVLNSGRALIWNLRSGHSAMLKPDESSDWITGVAFTDRGVGVLRLSAGRSVVNVYSTEPLR